MPAPVAQVLTPGERAAARTGGAPARGSLYVVVWILVLVLTQRFAIPLGGGGQQLPAAIPAALAVVMYGLARGHVVVCRRRAALLGVALVTLSLLTVVALIRGAEPSLLSFLLFVTIYPVALVDLLDARAARRGLDFFVDLMLVAAGVGLVLYGLQYAGLAYSDHLAQVVPPELLLTGFNTADPIEFGSELYRSNGVVFLEPSFFSLFLGLAAVISLVNRRRVVLLPLLLGGIAVTTAGNGLVVVLVSVAWLAVVGPRRRLLALVPSAAVAVAAASLTPLGALFVQRSGEIGADNSSASLRLVQPYVELFPAYVASPVTALLGQGAGSAQRLVEQQVGSLAVIVPAVPKLFVEYGWVGAVPVLVFLLHLVLARVRQASWAPALLVVYLVVNASLLQPTLAFVVITFCATLVRPAVTRRPTDDASATAGPVAAGEPHHDPDVPAGHRD
ncbi:MAG: hypothetical protein LH468_08035 [Nocardioides sp.]|nr:hypothetical protein [Nocardioides sp.]